MCSFAYCIARFVLSEAASRGGVERMRSTKLKQLFPDIFSRTSLIVEAGSSTIVVASLLRLHWTDALLVTENLEPVRKDTEHLFVGGYSVLANLLRKDPKNYYSFLFEPCESNAMGRNSVSVDQDPRDLLELFRNTMFRNTRFGFTCLKDGNLSSVVSLSDVIQLYVNGSIETDLLVKDVASSPFSLPRDANLKDAIGEMLNRSVRKVFIQGTKAFISDREIISFMFSPRRLEEVRDSPGSMLNSTIDEVGPIESEEVEGGMSIRDAARLITPTHGNTLLCDRGIITPWDLVMKPWSMGRLVLSGGASSS